MRTQHPVRHPGRGDQSHPTARPRKGWGSRPAAQILIELVPSVFLPPIFNFTFPRAASRLIRPSRPSLFPAHLPPYSLHIVSACHGHSPYPPTPSHHSRQHQYYDSTINTLSIILSACCVYHPYIVYRNYVLRLQCFVVLCCRFSRFCSILL